jgi:hypothetical protein
MLHVSHRHFLAALMLTVAGGCWDDGPPEVGGVALAVEPTQLSVGDSALATSRTLSRSGGQLSRRIAAQLTSSDASVLRVPPSSGGVVVALRPGEAWVRARYRDVADSVLVRVMARP